MSKDRLPNLLQKKGQPLARQRIRILSRSLIKGVAGGVNQAGLKRCFDAAAGFMEMAAVEKRQPTACSAMSGMARRMSESDR